VGSWSGSRQADLDAAITSSSAYSLHDLRKAHRLVHTRNRKRQILHHCAHPTALVSYTGPSARWSGTPDEGDVHDSIISCRLPLGSISIANRLSKPLTFVASLPNFCENASDRL
jgi:hypothetical protein